MAREIIDSVEKLEAELDRVRAAQREFATYTQEQVDKIFFAAASAADKMRLPLPIRQEFPWPRWRWKRPAWAW